MGMQVLASQWIGIAIVFGLILLDTLIAYVQAVRSHTWAWSKVGQFVSVNVFGKIGGLILSAVVANGLTPTTAGASQYAYWASVVAVIAQTLAGDIAGKLKGMAPSGAASAVEKGVVGDLESELDRFLRVHHIAKTIVAATSEAASTPADAAPKTPPQG